MAGSFKDAVFFYYGILEAYEIVGQELIGPDVLDTHAIPRMVYYINNFLPHTYVNKEEQELKSELKRFLTELKDKVNNQDEIDLNLQELWQLRAAIFGYESSFLEILGDNVIKNYVLKRIPEILAVYLPDVFANEGNSLDEKLQKYASFIKDNKFAKYANFSNKDGKVTFNVNHCAFAGIHDSDAYKEKKTRFCPWGMMALAIVNAHEQMEFPISGSIFVTRGTITKLEVLDK